MKLTIENNNLVLIKKIKKKERKNIVSHKINEITINSTICKELYLNQKEIEIDSTVMKYVNEYLFTINKNDLYVISRLKYDVVGCFEIVIDSSEKQTLYIVNEPETNIKEKNIINVNSELAQNILLKYKDSKFVFREKEVTIIDYILSNFKEEIVSLFGNEQLVINEIKELNINEKSFCEKMKFMCLNSKNKICFIEGYKRKTIEKDNFYFILSKDADIVRMNYKNTCVIEFAISIFKKDTLLIGNKEINMFLSNNEKLDLMTNKKMQKAEKTIQSNNNEKENNKKKKENNKTQKKKRKIQITGSVNPTIEKIYIYDKIIVSDPEDYEAITYIVLDHYGNPFKKGGYYIKSKDKYIIARDVLGKYENYKINVILINQHGIKIYEPQKQMENPFEKKNDLKYELEEESFLAKMGYSVREGISLYERRDALGKAIYKYGKAKVESHLRYLINRDEYNARMENANSKRESDLKWVINYKLNNQRNVNIN